MADGRPLLKVDSRNQYGSRVARRLRRAGKVPGVVYTSGEEARPLEADAHDLSLFLNEGYTLFDLKVEDRKEVPVVVKEEQRHPLRGELLHVDFHEVDLDVAIHADVTIDLLGTEEAPGVKEGGILEHVMREVTVEALPAEIPEAIEVDVSGMEIGDTLQLSVVTLPAGVELVIEDPDEYTVATLNPPRLEEEPEPEVEEEAELVGEEGEEAEEAPEGEEGGAPEGDEGDSGGNE